MLSKLRKVQFGGRFRHLLRSPTPATGFDRRNARIVINRDQRAAILDRSESNASRSILTHRYIDTGEVRE
jgi:hypothetical protein